MSNIMCKLSWPLARKVVPHKEAGMMLFYLLILFHSFEWHTSLFFVIFHQGFLFSNKCHEASSCCINRSSLRFRLLFSSAKQWHASPPHMISSSKRTQIHSWKQTRWKKETKIEGYHWLSSLSNILIYMIDEIKPSKSYWQNGWCFIEKEFSSYPE